MVSTPKGTAGRHRAEFPPAARTRKGADASASRTPRPLECVLLPTDFSDGAALALRRALQLPLAPNARLHIVHVMPEDLPGKSRARTTVRTLLSEAVDVVRADERSRQLKITTGVLQGRSFVEIIRCARMIDAELIVLGRHGAGRLYGMRIGSTAERIVRHGDLPVLVVNAKAARPYRRPMIATALDDSARQVVTLALRIVGPVKSIVVLHAYHVPYEGFVFAGTDEAPTDYQLAFRNRAGASLARFTASLSDLGVTCEGVLHRGDPRGAIQSETAERRIDLLAIGAHGRTGLPHAILGSVAEFAMRTVACDVLISRPAKETHGDSW
jgi:nucleotide-binding universal stress UspA family protein